MNTMYFTSEGAVMIDENSNPVGITSEVQGISRIYKLDQDTRIVYMKYDKKIELDGKAGQLLIFFYRDTFPNRVVLIDSKEWRENIDAHNKSVQEEKERWAKSEGHDISNTNVL